jgi:hypothetical protein
MWPLRHRNPAAESPGRPVEHADGIFVLERDEGAIAAIDCGAVLVFPTSVR